MSALPPHVIRQAQRILDGAARRILADKLNRDALSATATADDGTHEEDQVRRTQPTPDEGSK